MRPAVALAVLTALVLAPAPSAEGAGANRPRVALSVSPAHLAIAGPVARRIKLRNDGVERVVVDVGRRAVGPQTAAHTRVQIMPTRVVLPAGGSATLTLRVRPAPRAEPGDHHLLVLLTTRPLRGGRVNVQVRLGVRLRVRVPGRIVRRLILGGLRVHRVRTARFMSVAIANRGNVTVQLRGHIKASLFRRRRRVARLNAPARRVLAPGARTRLALRYVGRVRGPVTAVVQVRLGHGARVVERRYRIRL